MKIGFIGLGRMGSALVLNLLEHGIDVVVYNRTPEKIEDVERESRTLKASSHKLGILVKAYTINELVGLLDSPRIIWLMVPEGSPVDEVIDKLVEAGIEEGDVLVDGGNSYFKDSRRRFEQLSEKGINFLDVGTSGGLEGARNGACMMVGGDERAYRSVEKVFEAGSVKDGYEYFGPSGAGHFVKMVHNGIEYGMLQSIAEGFAVLEKGPYELDFQTVAKNWNRGSVIRGWLMELMEKAFRSDPKLDRVTGIIGGGKTGSWTSQTAKDLGIDTPVIDESIKAREKSYKSPSFAGKVVAALRFQFGGHEYQKTNDKEEKQKS